LSSRSTPQLSTGRKLLFGLVPALVLFGSVELILRAAGIPREKYVALEFEFPPKDLYGKAFLRDDERFWRLAPGYDGPWALYKDGYSFEAGDPTVDRARRRAEFPDRAYYQTVDWEVNEAGFRGPAPNASARTILFLGSSVTFGAGVRFEDSFAGRIRQRLGEEGRADWDVVDAGVPGYSTHQMLLYARELIPTLRPAVVIAEVGINDGVWAPRGSDRELSARKPSWMEALANRSNIVLAMHYAMRRSGDAGPSAPPPTGSDPLEKQDFYHSSFWVPGQERVPPEQFAENLAQIEALAHDVGAAFFVIVPAMYNEYGLGELARTVSTVYPQEIDVVGALREAPGPLESYFLPYDEAHLSREGHALVADLVWQALEEVRGLGAVAVPERGSD
jgi:lysophospholipase L1-like esterase